MPHVLRYMTDASAVLHEPPTGRVLAREFHEPPSAGCVLALGPCFMNPLRGCVLAREFHEPPSAGCVLALALMLKMMIPKWRLLKWIDLNSVGEEA